MPGDTVGIVAPAGPITEQQAKTAADKVAKAGYTPLLADGICKKFGYLAGTDADRANQLNSMFKNPDVKAIICARGGFGTTRLLDLLDYDLIRQNPKILGGYSDITALAMAVYKTTQLVTFHSSMLVPEDTEYTRNSMWSTFQNGQKNYKILCDEALGQNSDDPSQPVTILNPGKSRGTLIGGNLTLLQTLIGTKYDFSLHNKILFIEEINEPPYKVDRMLTHLKSTKNLKGLKGLIFGKMKGCGAQGENSLELDYIIDEFCAGLSIPIIKYYSFGHVKSRCTLPIGCRAELDTSKLQIRLLDDAVS